MQTVIEWEKENNKEYPLWAVVWHYDPYCESWMPEQWLSLRNFYKDERKQTVLDNAPMWQIYFEPIVAMPTDIPPKYGDGTLLKRTV